MDRAIAIFESMLTPELVGAVAFTLAATYVAKICAEHWMDKVTESASRWRAFSAVTTMAIGALAGLAAWAGTGASWFIIPAVAMGSTPAWRLVQVLMPARATDAFLTPTDRRYRGRSNAAG